MTLIKVRVGGKLAVFRDFDSAIGYLVTIKNQEQEQKKSNPFGLTEHQQMVYDAVMGTNGPRLTIAEFAAIHQVHYASPRTALIGALKKMGKSPKDYPDLFPIVEKKSKPVKVEAPDSENAEDEKHDSEYWNSYNRSRNEDSRQFKHLTLVAFVDQNLDLANVAVLDRLEDLSKFPPHLAPDLKTWNSIAPTRRLSMIRGYRRQLRSMRNNYALKLEGGSKKESDCPLCAGIADRRPIPGHCAVCLRPGETFVEEKSSVLGSSMATLIESA